MILHLSGLQLPLAHFALNVEAVLSGRVTGIYGASGAGKTSLLEVIAGLRRPVRGRVTLNGEILTDTPTRIYTAPEHRAIGYVPQEGALFPHLSVRENLQYGANPRRLPSAALTLENVAAVLELAELVERRIPTLSGGEKQRVALGRALLAAPRLLLLDEPLAGLDAPLRERLLPYLARVRDEFGIPMLYVTHAPDEVMALCDEVVVLTRGQIERRGAPIDLFAPSPSPRYMLRPRLSSAPPDTTGG